MRPAISHRVCFPTTCSGQGVVTFYRTPLAVVLLLISLAGMLAMLLLSLRHYRRVRDELRRHGLLQPAEPARPVAASLCPCATTTGPSPIPA
jgi:hypothetical protein